MKIKAYTRMDEVNKIHYSRNFEVVGNLPEVGDIFEGGEVKEITPVPLDYEQGNDEVYNYEFFKVVIVDEEGDAGSHFVAVEIPEPTEAELVAERMANSDKWDEEDCYALCELAGMSEEWEQADGENFEKVVEKAAEKLGVSIY